MYGIDSGDDNSRISGKVLDSKRNFETHNLTYTSHIDRDLLCKKTQAH